MKISIKLFKFLSMYLTSIFFLFSLFSESASSNQLIMAIEDGNGDVNVTRSADGESWEPPFSTPSTRKTNLPVSLVCTGGGNILMGRVDQQSNNIYYTPANLCGEKRTWSNSDFSPNNTWKTTLPVSLAFHNNKLYMGMVEEGGNIAVACERAPQWRLAHLPIRPYFTKTEGFLIPDSHPDSHGITWKYIYKMEIFLPFPKTFVSLASHTDGYLYLAMVDNFGRIDLSRSADGENWKDSYSPHVVPQVVPLGGEDERRWWSYKKAVSLASHKENLYMAMVDNTVVGRISLSRSADGKIWSVPSYINWWTPHAVSLVSYSYLYRDPNTGSNTIIRYLYMGIVDAKGDIHLAKSADGETWEIRNLNRNTRQPVTLLNCY
ncbi:hypothetical protein [Candidatus Odyssella acanthamoebae]|uniref:Sialidase domain-containing protein n=1 Tax=Candidatus Odyssella acanthamoebae TaxID=91604 RepID=A0A077AWB4_9PROT|nr:hypothetical protein [Candidatus Paracaedibacter acanthamoebae]AIK96716.1 hypothetical protein ID47_08270 [Candidatus Paracaedibacter acanthamoebae]